MQYFMFSVLKILRYSNKERIEQMFEERVVEIKELLGKTDCQSINDVLCCLYRDMCRSTSI